MWRDAASVRIKLEVPATQRHHCQHAVQACWLAISQVWFFYGLPSYFLKKTNPTNASLCGLIYEGLLETSMTSKHFSTLYIQY